MSISEIEQELRAAIDHAQVHGLTLRPNCTLGPKYCCPIGAHYLQHTGKRRWTSLVTPLVTYAKGKFPDTGQSFWLGLIDGFDGHVFNLEANAPYYDGHRLGQKFRPGE